MVRIVMAVVRLPLIAKMPLVHLELHLVLDQDVEGHVPWKCPRCDRSEASPSSSENREQAQNNIVITHPRKENDADAGGTHQVLVVVGSNSRAEEEALDIETSAAAVPPYSFDSSSCLRLG